MNNTHYLLLLLCTLTGLLHAQSYGGFALDNYAGVHGLLLNPANVAASRTGFEINLASASGSVSNDYMEFNGLKVRGAVRDDDFERAVISRNRQDGQSLYANADIVGPSLLMSFGDRTGIGVLTRARAFYNVAGMNGTFVEGTQDDFRGMGDFAFTQQDHYSTLNTWGEIALVAGTVLLDRQDHLLKAGASVKFLQGLGAVYSYGSRLDGTYDGERERLTVEGDVVYGRANDIYYDEITLGNRSAGFGFDFGLVYEWRPGDQNPKLPHQPYRIKFGASLLDVGSINYDNTPQTAYLIDETVSAKRLDEAYDTELMLSDNFDGTESEESVKINLPTTVQLQLDVRLTGNLYASAQYSMDHAVSDNRLANSVPNTLTVMARFESRGLGLYLPYTVRGDQSNTIGAGLRLGLFTIGSSSIVTQLLGGGGYAADVYAAVKFPFYRKGAGASAKALPEG